MKWRPFIDWRPNELGVGFSLSVERTKVYSLEPGDKSVEKAWAPDLWIHLGPIVAGIGWSS